jgi:hypothetical protein
MSSTPEQSRGPDRTASPRLGVVLPQSPSQYRLWFSNARYPDALDYHVIGMYRISGDIDMPALEYALREVENRHPALRSIFPDDEDGIQYVLEPGHVSLKRVSSPDPRSAAMVWLSRPFSLESTPPFRVAIIAGTCDSQFLCFALHHIVCDQHSWKIINREISLAYRRYRSGRWSARLGEDGYIRALRRESAARREIVRPDPARPGPVTGLRLPGLRSPRQRGSGLASVTLPQSLVSRMTAYGASLRATLSVVLLSVCGLLAGQLTGEDLITFTVPVSTREPEDEDTVGCFVNLAIMPLNVDPRLPAAKVVVGARDQLRAALNERMTPFQDVIAGLRSSGAILGRDLPRMASFNLVNVEEGDELELDGVTVAEERDTFLALRNDLSFAASQSGNTVSLTIRYDTSAVVGAAVEALAASVPVLGERLIRNPRLRGQQLLVGSPLEAAGIAAMGGVASTNRA